MPSSVPRSSRVVAEGKFLRLVVADHWEWVERVNASGGAVIVAVTPDRHLVLVEQYRIPIGARLLELPAGLAGDTPDAAGEATIEAARRELLEETGYEASDWQMLIEGYSSAGLTNESYHLFLARNAQGRRGRRRRPRADRSRHCPAGWHRRVATIAAPRGRSDRLEDLYGIIFPQPPMRWPRRWPSRCSAVLQSCGSRWA